MQTSNGIIEVKIAGDGANNCDRLTVFGTADLAGAVWVQLLNGYQPVAGMQESPFMKVLTGNHVGTLTPPPNWTVVTGDTVLTLLF